MIRKLGPRLRMMHLKDVKAKGGEANVLLGAGIARIPSDARVAPPEGFRPGRCRV
jgi:hypothetical protein